MIMAHWLACYTQNRYDVVVRYFLHLQIFVTNYGLSKIKMTNVSWVVYGQDIYQHKLVILTNLFHSVT